MRRTLCLFLLCIPGALFAQQPAPAQSYKLFFEKAYMHTDREAYAAGEDIWFKAYLVNAQTNQLINTSVNGFLGSTFYAPKYETPSAKPDLRTTIHWEPNITTNEKGEATITWYNADPKTKVRIVAEGITERATGSRHGCVRGEMMDYNI